MKPVVTQGQIKISSKDDVKVMKEANCKSLYTRMFENRHFAQSKIPNVTAGYLDPKGEPKNKSGGSLLTLKRIR